MAALRGTAEAANLLNLEDRDPNELNHKVQILFEDVIGEPEGAHSAPRIFRTSYRSYYLGRNCCFTCLSYLCAVPMAFCWGCTYALVSFLQIWQCTPCLRLFNQSFSCFASLYSTVTHCCLDPVYQAAALFLTRIHVTNVTSGRGYVDKKTAELNEMKALELDEI